MDDGKLRQILFQLQEQNKDLLNMVMNLQVSNNQLKQQVNVDFHKVYEELYNKKDVSEVKDFLESKKFIVGELNDIADKESNKAIEKFNENFETMEENLENIVS
jgi:serine/threonine protein kinase HipA of HipAB toxin-antitoxin module